MVSVSDLLRPRTSLAVLCAVFLGVTAILGSCVRFGAVGAPIPELHRFNSTTDPAYLVAKWEWQRSVFGVTLAADFTATVGLLLLIFTAFQLRKIYRTHEGVAHRAMYYCFVVGAFVTLFEFLQDLGVISMADWMTDPDSTWKVLSNDLALQALDVTYTVTVARSLWVFSLTNLLIGAGMLIEYYLESRNHKGHGLRKHSWLALGIACVAFLAWIFELAAFWSPEAVLFTAGAMTLLFVAGLCAWCVWLAFWIFPNFEETSNQPMQYI